MKRLAVMLAVVVAAFLTPTTQALEAPNSTTPCGVTTTAPAYTKWVVIVMENHSRSQTVGNMPYLDTVRNKCGDATNMTAEQHPSLGNYLYMTAGDNDGITTDCSPSTSCQSNLPSIFTQVSNWTFAESMGSNCRKTNTGEYVVRHNPETYFTQAAADCATDNVDLDSKLATKIANGTLRKFNFIVPNLLDDMHDGTIAQADTWLSQWLPTILDGPDYNAGNTAVVVTWDEPATSAPLTTPIETVVIAPSVPLGKDASTAFNHCSMLKTIELELGKSQLGCAATASSWRAAFNL